MVANESGVGLEAHAVGRRFGDHVALDDAFLGASPTAEVVVRRPRVRLRERADQKRQQPRHGNLCSGGAGV